MANLPVVRGRLTTSGGRAVLAARCPLCGREHRYDKGTPADPEVAELQARGFSEEWLPCQYDLPGNFWRITFGNVRRRRPVPPKGGPPEGEGRRPEGVQGGPPGPGPGSGPGPDVGLPPSPGPDAAPSRGGGTPGPRAGSRPPRRQGGEAREA